ncbi:MAG: GTP-binding protein [Candidatus Lokiarchaeota archaeon]|nr:GTP-binding protein [Candidatus Lokiarchaeota archaeon]
MVKKKINLKLALLGDGAVGKTSLINRYIDESFKDDYQPTLGVNIVMKKLKIEEFEIQLAIWDIAGQDKYDLTRKMFFEGCIACLLVFDITRSSTFDRIQSKWLEDFKKFARSDGIYIIIGKKSDLRNKDAVSTENGKILADQIHASDYIETSAKLGDNVEAAFKKLVVHALKKFDIELKLN